MQLSGIGVCAGIVRGPLASMVARPSGPPPETSAPDIAAERQRLAAAVAEVVADLRARADAADGRGESGTTAAEVLRTTALMAADPGWTSEAVRLIEGERLAAPVAFWRAAERFRSALAAAGGYFAERVRDIDDVRDRVIAALAGTAPPGIPDPGRPFVLVAHDLAPADTATLDARSVLALVTEEGGPTSHTAILARSLGIPAVVACAGITAVPDGTQLIVDGGSGQVASAPAEAADAPAVSAARAPGPVRVDYTGRLADGTPVALLANVGDGAGAAQARHLGAGGVGLLRTEFLFGGSSTAPAEEYQAAAYLEVFRHFPGRRVVVRTLDAGSDKPLPFLPLGVEANPALGRRGVRAVRTAPGLMGSQLAAIARAAGGSGAEVWTMAPMIAVPAEAAAFAAEAREHGLGPVGVMVEVPSAAILADEILDVVDFVSIGTNDLAQYTFAADRTAGSLAELNDPWQPALLRLIESTAAAGRRRGKPVGVCGEAAADPLLALVLVGLGVASLSATPRALPAVGGLLREATIDLCRHAAGLALSAPHPAAARSRVRAAADQACQAAATPA